jgi:NitT/TauT family transport system substrate-binding protein
MYAGPYAVTPPPPTSLQQFGKGAGRSAFSPWLARRAYILPASVFGCCVNGFRLTSVGSRIWIRDLDPHQAPDLLLLILVVSSSSFGGKMIRLYSCGIRTALLASCLFILTSCGGEKAESDIDGRASQVTELRTIRIGIIPIAEVAPLYIGIDKGFFAAEGLSLDLTRMAGGAAILPAVANGDVQVGFSNIVSLIIQAETDSGLVAFVGGSYETGADRNHALLVRRGESMQAKNYSKGTFGINTRKNIEELMLRRYLEASAINPDSVDYRTLPFPAMPTSLQNREIDVASTVEPFITSMTRDSQQVLARHYLLEAEDTVIVATYVATAKWLREHSDVAARFKRAFIRSTEYLNDASNRAEARSIIARHTSMPEETAYEMGLPLMIACIDRQMVETIESDVRRYRWIQRAVSVDQLIMPGMTHLCGKEQ